MGHSLLLEDKVGGIDSGVSVQVSEVNRIGQLKTKLQVHHRSTVDEVG